MTFLNIRKYLSLTATLFFFYPVKLAYSDKVKCDPSKEMPYMANLETWVREAVEEGTKLKYSCLPGYGFTSGDKIFSTFEVTCGSDGKFTGYKGISCQRACSVADALKLSNNVSSHPTYMKNGKETEVSSSALVSDNDIIKITCLPGYFLLDDNKKTTSETSYSYKCSNNPETTDAIRKCKIPSIIFTPTKPSSNSEGTIMRPCDLVSLEGIANAKITAADNQGSKPILSPSEEVTLSCSSGFSAIYKGKISEQINVKCDPRGSGRFIIYNSDATSEDAKYSPLVACSKRCNVNELVNKSSLGRGDNIDANSTPTFTFLYPENNQNAGSNLSQYQYANVNETVRIDCPAGYAIRSTNQFSYESTCLASGFDKQEVCEPEIKPCDNSDIDIGESIVYSPRGTATVTTNGLTGKTWVGMEIDLACQGSNEFYFEKKNGQNNIPRCLYKESDGTSYWDSKVFSCYNGCISADGSKRILTSQGEISTYSQARRIFSICEMDWRYLESGWKVAPSCTPPSSIENEMPQVFTALEGTMDKSWDTKWWTSEVTYPNIMSFAQTTATANLFNLLDNMRGGKLLMHTAFHVRETITALRCPSRQTVMEETKVIYDELHYPSIASQGNINYMFYSSDTYGDCIHNEKFRNGQFSACQESLQQHYGVLFTNAGKNMPSALSSTAVQNNIDIPSGKCSDIISALESNNIIKAMSFPGDKCGGSAIISNCGACVCNHQYEAITKNTFLRKTCVQGNVYTFYPITKL